MIGLSDPRSIGTFSIIGLSDPQSIGPSVFRDSPAVVMPPQKKKKNTIGLSASIAFKTRITLNILFAL